MSENESYDELTLSRRVAVQFELMSDDEKDDMCEFITIVAAAVLLRLNNKELTQPDTIEAYNEFETQLQMQLMRRGEFNV